MTSPPEYHDEQSPKVLDNLGATVQTQLQTHTERHPSHHPNVPGMGETSEQHAQHTHVPPKEHWGLSQTAETTLFYCCAIPAWGLEIAAAVVGSYTHAWHAPFIATISAFFVLHAIAWLMTAVGMMQRASWVRDESDLNDRRAFLYLAVRLNRLMMPTAVIALSVFIQAYARRDDTKDIAYWLLFLLAFIWNIVCSVMNAYNNITWECDRFAYEEGGSPFKYTRLAILGIGVPNKESKEVKMV